MWTCLLCSVTDQFLFDIFCGYGTDKLLRPLACRAFLRKEPRLSAGTSATRCATFSEAKVAFGVPEGACVADGGALFTKGFRCKFSTLFVPLQQGFCCPCCFSEERYCLVHRGRREIYRLASSSQIRGVDGQFHHRTMMVAGSAAVMKPRAKGTSASQMRTPSASVVTESESVAYGVVAKPPVGSR